MLSRVLWFLFLFIAPVAAFTQSLEWMNTTDGGGDHFLYSTAVDPSTGAVYTAGSFKNNILSSNGSTIIADVASETTVVNSEGEDDLFLAKYASDGSLVWSLTGGSNKKDEFLSVVVLPDGSILAGGYISRSIALQTSVGPQTITTSNMANKERAFLAHFSADGVLIDYVLHDTVANSGVVDLAVDATGYSILYQNDGTGYSANGVSYASDRQFFVERRNFSHTIQWIDGIGGSSNNVSANYDNTHAQLAVHEGKTAVHCSFRQDSQTFSRYDASGSFISSSNHELSFDDSDLDYLICLIDADGAMVWIKAILQNNNSLEGMGVAMDCNGVYVCGTGEGAFWSSIIFPGNAYRFAPNESVFLARLNSQSGNTDWAYVIESENSTDQEGAYALTTDDQGQVYCGGLFEEELDLNNWNSAHSGTTGGFVICYSSEGDYEWSQTIEGDENVVTFDLAILNDQLYACGRGSGNMNDGPVSASDKSGFIANYSLPASGSSLCYQFGNAGPLSATVEDNCGALTATFSYPNKPISDFILQYSADGALYNDLIAFGSNDEFTLNGASEGFYRLWTNSADCGTYLSNGIEIVAPPAGNANHPGGGTCNLAYWLRADLQASDGTADYANNEQGLVNTWTDLESTYPSFARDENHNELDENRPFRKANQFNGHPTVMFDGNDNMVLDQKAVFGNSEGLHYWMVLVADTNMYTKRTLLNVGNPDAGYGIDIDRDSVGVWTPNGDYFRAAHHHFNQPFILETVFDSAEGTYIVIDGTDTVYHSAGAVAILDEASILYNEFMNSDPNDGGPFVFGMPSEAYDESKGFMGEVAEVIAYQGLTSQEDAMRIRSYLALRYGITLNHPPVTDYVGTSGNVVMGFTGALAELNNDVFGIGADADAYFYQEGSRSIEPSSIIRIDKVDAGITEDAFLVFGHNGASARPSVNYLGQDSIRMPRYWGISENVDFGNVRISMPDAPNNPYTTLLLSTDSLFTGVFESICLTPDNGMRRAEFNAIHNTYFTFATSNFALAENINPVSCNGLGDGSIELTATGTGPFNFEWEELGLSGEEMNELEDLSSGQYSVSITDGAGCVTMYEFEITEPTSLNLISNSVQSTTCLTNADGGASFEITDGTPGYVFSLDFDAGGNPVGLYSNEVVPVNGEIDLADLLTGDYSMTVEDTNGCTVAYDFSIVSNDTTAPVVACLGSVERSAAADCTYALEDFTSGVSITETCGIESTSQLPAPGTSLTPGVHSIEISVVDASGNTGTCSFELTVVDDTPPVVTCLADQVRSVNNACAYQVEDFTALVSVSENCGTITSTQTPIAGTTLSLGTHTITITSTDEALNSASCSFDLTINDITAPSMFCLTNQVREVTDGCDYSVEDFTSSIIVTDNCGLGSLSQIPSQGTSLSIGNHTIEIHAEDAVGNESICTFNLLVQDSTNPIVVCPGDQIRSASASCIYLLEDFTSLASVTESCGVDSNTQLPAPGALLSPGVYTVEITVVDDSGNTGTCSFELTVVDDTPQVVTCPADQTRSVNASCNYTVENFIPLVTGTDNCGNVVYAQSPSVGTDLPIGVHTISIVAFDELLNSSSCTFDLTVLDSTIPSLTCVSNQTRSAGSGCVYLLEDFTTIATSSDNCSMVDVVQSPDVGTALSLGVNTIEITSTDVSGNQASCTFDLTVVDTTIPSLTCPSNKTRSANNACTYLLEDFTSEVIASDACGIASIQQLPAPGTPLNLGVQSISIEVTDANGNTTDCSFTVTVEDTTAPLIDCLSTQEIELEGTCEFLVPDYSTMLSITENCGIQLFEQSIPAGTLIGPGEYTILIQVTDLSGNTAECSILLQIEDDSDPTFNCIPDSELYIASGCSYVLEDFTSSMNISDNCGIGSVIQTPAAGTLLGIGTHEISVTITDLSGNLSVCDFEVDIIDSIDPTISCLSDLTVWPNASCIYTLADFTSSVAVNDNCTVASVVQNPSVGTSLTAGYHTIELTVFDSSNNSATCSFELFVEDTEDPVLDCPESVTIELSTGCTYLLDDFVSSTIVTDNCEIDEVYQVPAAGTLLSLGWQTINIFASDVSGNISSCSFQLFVEDVQAPQFACFDDQTRTIGADCTYELEHFPDGMPISENCSIASVTQIPAAGALLAPGTHTITIQVIDNSGLSTSCSFQLFVEDSTDPVINCASELNFQTTNCNFMLPSLVSEVGVLEECSSYTVTQSIASGTSLGVGTYTLTFTVTDANGNSSLCDTELNITDTTSPIIACESVYNVLPNSDCDFVVGNWSGIVSATDNCSFSITSDLDGQTLAAGTYPIEFTVVDANGNSATCSSVLEVPTLEEPTIVCPTSIDISIDSNCDTFVPDASDYVFAAAACGNNSTLLFTQSIAIGSPFDFNTPLMVTVEDEFGQLSSCSTQLIRVDNLEPVIECPEIIIVELNPDCSVPALDLENLVSIDDCSLTFTQTNFEDLVIDGPGSYEVDYQVTDAYGLISTCSSQILFQDNEAPELDCFDDQVQALDVNCSYVMPDFTELANAFDACGPVNVTQSPSPGVIYASTQEIDVVLHAEDQSGNETACSFVLELIDQTPPAITCVEDQEIEFEGCALSLPSFSSGLSDDACGIITIVQEPLAGSLLVPGVYTIELTATDESMNVSSCSFELTVIKADGIEITCSDELEVSGSSCEFILEDYTSLVEVTNACGEFGLVQTPAPGTPVQEGVTEVSFSATDDYTTATCSFELIYNINQIITTTCPFDVEVENDFGACGAVVDYPLPQIMINCSEATLELTEGLAPGSFFELGQTEISYDFFVEGTYISTCSFFVIVTDAEAPQFACNESIVSCENIVSFAVPTAIDNCSEVTITQIDESGYESGDAFSLGTTELTFLATDEAGNESTCTFDVTVVESVFVEFTEDALFKCETDETLDLTSYLNYTDGTVEWIGDIVDENGMAELQTAGTFVLEAVVSLGVCSNSDTIELTVGELPVVNAGNDFDVCGLQTELQASGDAVFWEWESDMNGVILSNANTMSPVVEGDFYMTVSYMLEGTSEEGCAAFDEVEVTFYEPVTAVSLGEDMELLNANPVTIDANFNGIGTLDWNWEGPNELQQTDVGTGVIEVAGFIPGTYDLVVIVSNGPCVATSDSLLISLDEVLIPTGFSPNGDNKNETFVIRGASQFDQIKFKVFSRSGIEVFATDDYKNDWGGISSKGRELPSDTYYIILELDDETYQGYLVLRR